MARVSPSQALLAPLQGAQREAWWLAAASMALCMLLVAGLMAWMAQPLAQLTHSARQLLRRSTRAGLPQGTVVWPRAGGEVGELVLTTINREAMPLLRYRTRDLTRILPGECPCGRHHKRLDRMKGRSDDMIILKGVNIFPIQIETILLQFKELGSDYLITLETAESNDEMTVEVELSQLFTDDYGRLQALTREITRQLKYDIVVTPRVKLVPKGALPKSEGKAVRVKDLRKTF